MQAVYVPWNHLHHEHPLFKSLSDSKLLQFLNSCQISSHTVICYSRYSHMSQWISYQTTATITLIGQAPPTNQSQCSRQWLAAENGWAGQVLIYDTPANVFVSIRSGHCPANSREAFSTTCQWKIGWPCLCLSTLMANYWIHIYNVSL